MKKVTMFITSWCPYCKQAAAYMEKLKLENPEYNELTIDVVDEELHPEISKQYSYYYVPTYYVEDEKVHEGVPSLDIVKNVFDKALKS